MVPLAISLAAVAASYRVLFVDVWGVVHDGLAPFQPASEALRAARQAGKRVLLISNAPRLGKDIPPQLDRIGVRRDIYDDIATSGDASREIIAGWAGSGVRRIHHIGPERDLSIFSGLNIERVGLAQADHVVCTGLFDDERETPADYEACLAEIARRRLPFLCANPDIVVQRGTRLLYCAGALAERLAALGGAPLYAGKPHAPIYALALAKARALVGGAVRKSEILAVGDGLKTDILGAERFGIASLLIAHGVHGGELRRGGEVDLAQVDSACAALGVHPLAVMEALAP